MSDNDGPLVITGQQNIQAFQYLRVMHGLALEINTGMKVSSRGSTMNYAKEICGSPKRTKRGVLVDYIAWFRANVDADYEPSKSIARAYLSLPE